MIESVAAALDLRLQRRDLIVGFERPARSVFGARLDAPSVFAYAVERALGLAQLLARIGHGAARSVQRAALDAIDDDQLEQAMARLVERQIFELAAVMQEALG